MVFVAQPKGFENLNDISKESKQLKKGNRLSQLQKKVWVYIYLSYVVKMRL